MHRLFLVALFAISARATLAEVTIHLVASDQAPTSRFCVKGLSPQTLQSLEQLPAERLSEHFKLFVATIGEDPSVPSVLGDCSIDREQLIFQPRFGLSAGQTYRAEFLAPLAERPTTKATFHIPEATRAEKTTLDAIYPSASELPQNVLRFYLHFSAPMKQGGVYRFISISHENGEQLALPFLEISEELWDQTGTRLTLLLDPSRVKRGLVAREEDGAILERGKKYRLRVSAAWPDVHGMPLGSDAIKEFTVTNEDFSQPNPREWSVSIASGSDSDFSRRSVQLVFPDPLDHALLGRCIRVIDSMGKNVPGKVEVSDHERRWVFSPNASWKRGEYSLRIDPILEDIAGNSIARPFEVDLTKPAVAPEIQSLQFVIR